MGRRVWWGIFALLIGAGCGGGSDENDSADAASSVDARISVDADTTDAVAPPDALTLVPVTVQLTTFSGEAQTAMPLIAFRDGGGAWVDGTSLSTARGVGGAGSYTFNAASGKYGIAWACPPSSLFATIRVFYGTSADGAPATLGCSGSPDHQLTVTVNGLGTGEVAGVIVGPTSVTVNDSAPTKVVDVAAGTHDVFIRQETRATSDEFLP